MMRTIGGALFTSLALVAGSTLPAAAQSRTVEDEGDEVPIPACHNLFSATFANAQQFLWLTVQVKQVSKSCSRVIFYWDMWDEPGWAYRVDARWIQGKKRVRLEEEVNGGDWQFKSCPGLTSTWNLDSIGSVTLKIPQRCMYGPRTFENFSALTIPKGATHGHDSLRYESPLRAG